MNVFGILCTSVGAQNLAEGLGPRGGGLPYEIDGDARRLT